MSKELDLHVQRHALGGGEGLRKSSVLMRIDKTFNPVSEAVSISV